MPVQLTESANTIVALSSGQLPSGVAVIRISGPSCSAVESHLFSSSLPIRRAVVRKLTDGKGEILDNVLVLKFVAEQSFTGEDVIEIHAHGGRATVAAILRTLCDLPDIRLAEAGEFTRRAFENGRLDLTEVDGIADLISADTEAQRKLALQLASGSLRELYEGWRMELVHIRAMIEAEFDFSDEEDVPDDISQAGFERLDALAGAISNHLNDNRAGEIIRDGYRVAIMGKPNAGKSSLLNALAKRDVAIVSDQAGTTRDVIEVSLDLNGLAVRLFDTAGIRDTAGEIEAEGIRRANKVADECDLVLWLAEPGDESAVAYSGETPVVRLTSKMDSAAKMEQSISVVRDDGLDWLLDEIAERLANAANTPESLLLSRERYRQQLNRALAHLVRARDESSISMELRAEELRRAGDCIGQITGKVDVEDLLDVIFSEFCVGK